MTFPRLVFISPGKTECQGGTYDSDLAHNAAEFSAAIKAGYHATLPEAVAAAAELRASMAHFSDAAPIMTVTRKSATKRRVGN